MVAAPDICKDACAFDHHSAIYIVLVGGISADWWRIIFHFAKIGLELITTKIRVQSSDGQAGSIIHSYCGHTCTGCLIGCQTSDSIPIALVGIRYVGQTHRLTHLFACIIIDIVTVSSSLFCDVKFASSILHASILAVLVGAKMRTGGRCRSSTGIAYPLAILVKLHDAIRFGCENIAG